MKNEHKSCIQLLVALIGAIAMIVSAILGVVSAVLGNERLTDWMLRTTEVSIIANPTASGSATYLSGNDLLTFDKTSNISIVGDTETDQLIKAFFSFYLGDIPQQAKILDAQIIIPCDTIGHPESLSPLTLREFAFGQYDQSDFYGAPTMNWSITWDIDNNICQYPFKLGSASGQLTGLVQQKLDDNWLQFVLLLQDGMVIPNQQADAIVLNNPPILNVKYQLPP